MPRDHREADFVAPLVEDFDSPHALFAELRQRCPVAYSNEMGGFWAVTKYEDIVRVLTDWETFTTRIQNVVPEVATTKRRPPLHLDPPGNVPYRTAILKFLSPKRVAVWQERVNEMVRQYLDPLIAKGGGDICREFSFNLPIALLSEFFRIPADDAERIRVIGYEFSMAIQVEDQNKMREKSDELYQIAASLIDNRIANPQDPDVDPVSSVLATRDLDGELLAPSLVLGAVRQFLMVGIVAPTTFIGSMAVHLARHPEHHKALKEHPEHIPAAMDEILRLYTPYRGFARTATRDVVLGDKLINEGDALAVVFTSGNRDEEKFDDPDSFRLDRDPAQLLTFGRGPHMCPGAPLAKLLLTATLRELVMRTNRLSIAGEIVMTKWPEYGPVIAPIRIE